MAQFFLAASGLSFGVLVSRTADRILLYEKGVFLGVVWGTLMTVFPDIRMPFGALGLGICGIFTGVFVGGWILALAELANVFPVFSRRLGITRGAVFLVLSLAAGKTAGSLYLFFMGWGKG